MLSDQDIMHEVTRGNIIIDPFYISYLQPASYDVHLDDTLLVPEEDTISRGIDPSSIPPDMIGRIWKEIRLQQRDAIDEWWIPPGGVALGATRELITLHPEAPLAADIAGCSSLGRWFLFVHVTAGFVDPGWSGRLTLEFYNASPWWIRLWSGMRIAQLRFYELRSTAQRSYLETGHYAGAITVQPSEYHT